jgi:hypothetical protein
MQSRVRRGRLGGNVEALIVDQNCRDSSPTLLGQTLAFVYHGCEISRVLYPLWMMCMPSLESVCCTYCEEGYFVSFDPH